MRGHVEEIKMLTEDWMLSELILNDGFSKQQLASYLEASLPEINKALSQKQARRINKKFRSKLQHFYLNHHY